MPWAAAAGGSPPETEPGESARSVTDNEAVPAASTPWVVSRERGVSVPAPTPTAATVASPPNNSSRSTGTPKPTPAAATATAPETATAVAGPPA